MDLGKFEKKEYFVNRELSWLKFDERVLSEARDKNLPLFDRLKFLSITGPKADIDRVVKELQQYSNETCDFDAIFYTEQEMWDNIATRNLDNSSWGTPYTVLPDTYSSCDELYGVVKGGIKDLYGRIGNDQAHIVVYQQWHGDGSAINSGGKPAWEIYLLY